MSDKFIDMVRAVDTPTLSNAIELMGIRPSDEGLAPLSVRCLFPELGPMCGYAVTAQVETLTRANAPAEASFIELFEAVERSPKPAVVAFQEIGPSPDFAAHAGEIMATVFSRLGAIGLVSDCGVRDMAEVRALKFHYFARGSVASHAHFHVVRVGVPIQVIGLEIRPGALLHGDVNGLITVPPEAANGVLEAVQKVRAREKALLDFVRRPEFKAENLKGRFLE